MLDEGFIQKCRDAFNTFDFDGSGTIDTQEMKKLLEAIGQRPSEEELIQFMADVDEKGVGEIEFSDFLRAFEKQRNPAVNVEEENDIRGNKDKSGVTNGKLISQVVNSEYGLPLRLDLLYEDLNIDISGNLTFVDFRKLFA